MKIKVKDFCKPIVRVEGEDLSSVLCGQVNCILSTHAVAKDLLHKIV